MSLIVTKGLGSQGLGVDSELLVTIGYGGVAGTGVSATIKSRDARHLDVLFNVAVRDSDASDPTKYTIPGLEVFESVYVDDFYYVLTTSRQQLGFPYVLTIGSIAPK